MRIMFYNEEKQDYEGGSGGRISGDGGECTSMFEEKIM